MWFLLFSQPSVHKLLHRRHNIQLINETSNVKWALAWCYMFFYLQVHVYTLWSQACLISTTVSPPLCAFPPPAVTGRPFGVIVLLLRGVDKVFWS